MKYFVEYYTPDKENEPYEGRYNIYVKRWWWSRKKILKTGIEVDGGIATVINSILIPHMKSFNTCEAWSDVCPERKEINL